MAVINTHGLNRCRKVDTMANGHIARPLEGLRMKALIIAILLASGISLHAAQSAVPRVIALQVGQKQTFDLTLLGDYLGLEGFPANFPNWSVSSVDASVVVSRLDATKFALTIKSEGAKRFVFSPTGNTFGLPIPVTGYSLDRTGVYKPRVIPTNDLSFDAAAPTTLKGSMIMRPFVRGVKYDVSFFAHKTTFVDGKRSFSVTTGDKMTSLGEMGWTVSKDAAGVEIGKLEFTMIVPGGETSWCLKSVQTQQWPELNTTPSSNN